MLLHLCTWQEVERNHIRVTLELTGGNRQRAARTLGISERTLYRDIESLRAGGCLTVAITNDTGSPLAEAAQTVLPIHYWFT